MSQVGGSLISAAALQSSSQLLTPFSLGCAGRLTLTSATPVTTSDVTGASTLYWTPYKGGAVSLYNGSAWVTQAVTEKSLAIAATSGLPYDVFMDASTQVLSQVAWSTATARATALAVQDGIYVKSGDTSKLYLGTFYASASNSVDDSVLKRHLWNNYNRVKRSLKRLETASSWTYSSATVRQANGNTANQLDIVNGLSEDMVNINMLVVARNGANGSQQASIGVDSITAFSAEATSGQGSGGASSASATNTITAFYRGYPGIGRHYFSWLESTQAIDVTTWTGAVGVAQSGIQGEVMA